MRNIAIKQKRAVSLIVSYVLLLVMAVSMAGMIYGWLKYQARLPAEIKCPEGVGIAITYDCNATHFNITVYNQGLFRIDGYRLILKNETNQQTFFNYTSIAPGNSSYALYEFSNTKQIEVLPFRIQKKGNIQREVFCTDALIRLDVNCA